MAKVEGPLFSLEARGAVGKAIVFFPWHGRHVVRQWKKPTNPQTAAQYSVRGKLRAAVDPMHFCNATALKDGADPLTDIEQIKAITPDNTIWNAFLVENELGDNNTNFDAAKVIYDALIEGEKTAWCTAADALVPPVCATALYKDGLPVTGTEYTSGANFFTYRYGLYKMGLDAVPDATPPTYA